MSGKFPETRKKPNVIWVLVDQMRGQAMGFKGDVNVKTPNLDTLSREGVSFDCAVSGNPWCCPFRGALLTGLYPHVNGVIQTPSALDPTIPTITKPFHDAGYHTAWVGKWHLDGSNSVRHYVPADRRGGFDYFMGYENNNNQNESYVFGNDSEDFMRLEGYETDALHNLFIDHIKQHVAEKEDYQPFFAALSIQPPHSPYLLPYDESGTGKYYKNPADIQLRPNVPYGTWSDQARFDLAGYYGMIEHIDANLGKLRRTLQELNIDRDTFIIFMADHGDCHCSHGQQAKSSPWEESIRIPFIVGKVGAGDHMKEQNTDALINHIDIAPTTLGLCGIPVPKDMQGYDYSSLCLYKSDENYHENEKAMPTSAYLQHIVEKKHPHSINKRWRGVVTDDGWKYVCLPNTDAFLFNLKDDPYEMANLVHDSAFQKDKERLHALLKQYIEDTRDIFELPII